mmetsp:Transcript_33564/g.108296  ORF Transcript_33564/g.108296 Transcript_33564/m.108296 type:complete len:254 (-) Transcript_33564:111-872(-)
MRLPLHLLCPPSQLGTLPLDGRLELGGDGRVRAGGGLELRLEMLPLHFELPGEEQGILVHDRLVLVLKPPLLHLERRRVHLPSRVAPRSRRAAARVAARVRQLDQLAVDQHKGHKVVPHVALLRRLRRVALCSLRDVDGLKVGVRVQRRGALLGCHRARRSEVLAQHRLLRQPAHRSEVVVDGVDAGDHTARVVQVARLLHVKLDRQRRVAARLLLLLLEPLHIGDDGDDRLRQEGQKVLVEAEHLAKGPLRR